MLRGDAVATKSLDQSTGPSQALPYSLKLSVTAASKRDEAGLTNPGFWGFGLRPDTTYSGSFYARVENPDIGPIAVRMVNDATGAVEAQAQLALQAGPWKLYEYKLTTGAVPRSTARHLEFTVSHPGTVWLQLMSLMQPTFNGRPNGNRVDLMERMAAMHPRFLRLPGGNYLEGNRLEDWYDWKKTIGPLVNRPGHQGPWFYWSTDGLGLLEFLEWCEDLKVEPVLAVYAGYSLGGRHVATGKDLEPYVQAALDEVEYVTGDVSTRWGAERARDGHPAPFPLQYIEIGNEDYLDKSGSYTSRYAQFAEALHRRYPQFKLIATDGNSEYETKVHPDVSDEHYYKSPADMMDLVHHYDKAPRSGPEDFRRRVGYALRNTDAQFRRCTRRCGVDDLARTQQRLGCYGKLRSVAGQCEPRRHAVADGPDWVRRGNNVRVAELLGSVSLRRALRRWHTKELSIRRKQTLLLLRYREFAKEGVAS